MNGKQGYVSRLKALVGNIGVGIPRVPGIQLKPHVDQLAGRDGGGPGRPAPEVIHLFQVADAPGTRHVAGKGMSARVVPMRQRHPVTPTAPHLDRSNAPVSEVMYVPVLRAAGQADGGAGHAVKRNVPRGRAATLTGVARGTNDKG